MRRFCALVVFMVCACSLVPAQTAENRTPLPYGEDEFYTWQKDLRRAEIITFGALPFVTFMSSIYYDIYRYYDHDQDDAYLPWPLKKDTSVPMSEDEQIGILKASIGIAIGVALFDFGFRAIRRAIRKSRIDKANREIVQPIVIEEIDESGLPVKSPEGKDTNADDAAPADTDVDADARAGSDAGADTGGSPFKNEPSLQGND